MTFVAAVYIAVFAALAAFRWQRWTIGTDNGIFTQVAHSAFTGFSDGPEGGTHFRFHWSPILVILTPLVDIVRSGFVMQLAQVVLVALCALPMYGIARAYVPEARAVAYASLVFLYPPLCALAFTEFHELAFYPVLALTLFWAADRARWWVFGGVAIAGALVREDTCILFAIVGAIFVVIGFARRNKLWLPARGLLVGAPREPKRLAMSGLGLIIVNVAALIVYYKFIMPGIGPWEPSSHFYDYPFAQGPAQVVAALVIHPTNFRYVASLGRLRYLIEALAPLAFLPLASRWSFLALPGLAMVLLASDPIVWHMGSHYAALWAPWFLLGTLSVLIRSRYSISLYRASIVCSVAILMAFNPMHIGHFVRPAYEHDDAARALASIPADAAVVTHYDWFAQIAYAQPNSTVYFCPSTRYAVFDSHYFDDDYPNGYFRNQILPEINRELTSGRMRVIGTYGTVRVYERRPSTTERLQRCRHIGDAGYTSLAGALAD